MNNILAQVEQKVEPPAHTYTAFSGADVVIKLNDHMLSEIQELHYMEYLKPEFDEDGKELPPVSGWMDSIILGFEPTIRKALREVPKGTLFSDEFELLFMNEFGQKMKIVFVDAVFTHAKSAMSVDMVVQSERFFFTAESIRFIEQEEIEENETV